MVKLEWTPRLNKAFQKLHTKTTTTSPTLKLDADETKTLKDVGALLQSTEQPACVDMDLVKRVSALLLKYSAYRSNGSSNICDNNNIEHHDDWVHVMIKGSSVYIPKASPKERSPELERLMDGIKAQLAEKEYQRMVSNIDPDTLNASSIASGIRQDMKDMKEVKAHAIGIVNVLYTGAAVFTAVFLISAHFTEDLGMRVLLSFLGFVLIVACEAYLYSRHVSVAKTRTKRKELRLPEDTVAITRSFSKDKRD
ncbi:MAG: endoplasmic reticulum-based factor for assembly of V-ATPase-domain-containing protein [Benniella sp.]|nr:MAG: endoplasmic reticulum-based factor for assembly of V-ATPase-domain-containing protein [Benniella sp.]